MTIDETWKLTNLCSNANNDFNTIKSLFTSLEQSIQKAINLRSISNKLDAQAEISNKARELGSLVTCMVSEDSNDTKALQLESHLSDLEVFLDKLNRSVSIDLSALSDKEFQTLLSKKSDLNFILNEKRKQFKRLLPPEKEDLITVLTKASHENMTTLYYHTIGKIKFPYQGKNLSISQLEQYLNDVDPKQRQEAFSVLQSHLKEEEETFALILNSIIDFRNKVYQQRNWPLLEETLTYNRTSAKTLDSLCSVIDKNKPILATFLKIKAELIGKEKLDWYDIEAPIKPSQYNNISIEEGYKIIFNSFKEVSEDLHNFAQKALKQQFTHSAKSSKKRAGGFCIDCPEIKESRILLTWGGDLTSLSTLAHELGHAYHNEIIFSEKEHNQHFSMNVAETASTMCEAIVIDYMIKNETDPSKKLLLLEDKISRAIAFAMNIPMRFDFDQKIHTQRKEGFLFAEKLNQLMDKSALNAYANAINTTFPNFWCYKMHFYFTDVAFYNWPYAFGYLFSLGIFSSIGGNSNFQEKYNALLSDTGKMSTEELCKKHLNFNLAEPHFWEKAFTLIENDIKDFLKLKELLAFSIPKNTNA